VARFRRDARAILWQDGSQLVRIEPWGRDALRVRAALGAAIRDDLPGALLPPMPADTGTEIEIGEARATLRQGAIAAEIAAGGLIRFLDAGTDDELLAEAPRWLLSPPARSFHRLGGDRVRAEARFVAYEGERLYGLGQHPHGRLDQKGCTVDLVQRNTEIAIPFLLSSRGYGFLWNNPAVGRVELAHNGTRWVADATRQLDYWIVAGATPAAILGRYADATGHAPMLPAWAAGFWQSRNRYPSQEELLAVAREHVTRGLPLSVIAADYLHWPRHGDWRFDPVSWPDPAGMVRELAAMGVRLMVSIWPTLNPESANAAVMRERGWLVATPDGQPAVTIFTDTHAEGDVALYLYDATHPEARAFLWERVRDGYHRHGISVFWLDACEPEIIAAPPQAFRYHLGDGREVSNLYPLLHARAIHDGLRAAGATETVMVTRSAWAGSQRYGSAVWSGDIESTWESLRAQVRAGLNMGLSGIPWWHADVGGYALGEPDSEAFRELLIRWFQYAVFTPILRLHGHRLPDRPGAKMVGAPNEVWSFGEEAYAIIGELLRLGERLRPYVLAQMRTAHERGLPPMRPLFVDFPHDLEAVAEEDVFMFGPDLLVAPVLHPGATERSAYLPAGTDWTEAWSGTAVTGGQRLTAPAPLDRIPLYVRAGAELPIRSAAM
jgi:alpha-D-xyloside xylohydrolase